MFKTRGQPEDTTIWGTDYQRPPKETPEDQIRTSDRVGTMQNRTMDIHQAIKDT